MTTLNPGSDQLSNEDLSKISGGNSARIDEIDLPLNEYSALRDVDSNLYDKLMAPGWTQETFCNAVKHLSNDAASALFKVSGHSDWLAPVRGYRGS